MNKEIATANSCSGSKRLSNLELMRIVLMLFIIAHHSVVNSGVMWLWDPSTLHGKAMFLTIWGMWGKVCINAFVMITGYFMCTSRLTWVKFARLLFTVCFWNAALGLVFVGLGLMGGGELSATLLSPFVSVDNSFTASFLIMYLMIPFLNALLSTLDRRGLQRLLLLLLWVSVVCTTFLRSPTAFSEVRWYATLYLVAAYIRLYPARWFDDPVVSRRAFLVCVALSVASVVGILAVQAATGAGSVTTSYFFVNDSGKVLAFLTGITCFLFFKNLKMPHVPAMNAVASTAFGVLLIHANSDAMRTWLWGSVLDIPGAYAHMGGMQLVAYMVLVMFGVFAACSAMEALRLRFVEKPLFRWLDANRAEIERYFNRIGRSLHLEN